MLHQADARHLRARTVFAGDAGRHGPGLGHHEELDGFSIFAVPVCGGLIDGFPFDERLGSAFPDAGTRTTREISKLALDHTGDLDLIGAHTAGVTILRNTGAARFCAGPTLVARTPTDRRIGLLEEVIAPNSILDTLRALTR